MRRWAWAVLAGCVATSAGAQDEGTEAPAQQPQAPAEPFPTEPQPEMPAEAPPAPPEPEAPAEQPAAQPEPEPEMPVEPETPAEREPADEEPEVLVQPPSPRVRLGGRAPADEAEALGVPEEIFRVDPQLRTASQLASERLGEARILLAREAWEEAAVALDGVAASLALLMQATPGAALADALAEQAALLEASGQPVELRPLVERVDAWRAVLPPEVPAQLRAAQRQLDRGDRQAALAALLEAHQRLTQDLGLQAAAEAYGQVRAAHAELEAGNPKLARQLVFHAPAVLARVAVAAPLVPVRLQLRAAAAAAERGDWSRVEEQLNTTMRDLQELRTWPRPEVAAQARILDARARALQALVTESRQPSPRTFRRLAQEAVVPPAG